MKETTVEFNVLLSENIELKYGRKKKFKLSDATKIIFYQDDFFKEKKIMLYSIGENINYFSLKVKSDSNYIFSNKNFIMVMV